jgi:hypothetical protein
MFDKRRARDEAVNQVCEGLSDSIVQIRDVLRTFEAALNDFHRRISQLEQRAPPAPDAAPADNRLLQ